MKHAEFSWQNAQGQKIYAQEWQPEGSTQAVVALVHGLGEHSSRYVHLAEIFTQAGVALLAFDLPGHGKSDGKRGHSSFRWIAQDIDRLLEEASRRYPGKAQFLYGHSLGGELVLYYLLTQQPGIKGAIVTSPGISPGVPVPALKITLGKIIHRVQPSFSMENGLDLSYLSHDSDVVQAYRQDPLVHSKVSAQLGMDILQTGPWLIEQAAEISIPLLLVQGEKDRIVSVEDTRKFASRAPAERVTYKEWEGLFHETHNELEKQQVIQYTLDWITCQLRANPDGAAILRHNAPDDLPGINQ